MTDTPRTDALIAEVRKEHVEQGLGDFDHYIGMTGSLAQWARELERVLATLLRYTEACEGMLNVTPAGQVIAARQLLALPVPDCDCGYTDSKCAIDCPTQKGWPDDPLKEAGIEGHQQECGK